MGKSFATVFTLERLFSCMNSFVFLEVVFELESFSTMTAFEFPQVRSVRMVGHVSLQLVEGRELFAAKRAGHICIFWMISVHVALQQGESREGPSAVAGDVGGGLEPTHPGRGTGESRAKERGRQGAVFVKRADNT